MSVSVGVIEATLLLNDQFTKTLDRAYSSFKSYADTIETQNKRIAMSIDNMNLDKKYGKYADAAKQLIGNVNNATVAFRSHKISQDQMTTAVELATKQFKLQKEAIDNKELEKYTDSGYSVEKMLVRLALRVIAVQTAYKLLHATIASVGEANELNKMLTQIEVVTNAGSKGVAELTASFGRFASTVGKGPAEISKAYYLIASASQDASKNMDVLNVAAKASAVGLGDTADIAKTLIGVINAYGKENLTAARAGDILFETVKQGGAEAKDIAPVIGRVAALAAEMGVSFEEVGTFLATFTRVGVGADEAVTALRGTLNSLITPTEKQKEVLKDLGMTMAQFRDEIQNKGLTQAMVDLITKANGNKKALGDLENAFGTLFPNVRALAGILSVYNSQGDAAILIQKAIAASSDSLNDGLEKTGDKGALAMDKIKAQGELLKVQLGQALLPAVAEAGAEIIKNFDPAIMTTFARALSNMIPILTTIVVVVEKWWAFMSKVWDLMMNMTHADQIAGALRFVFGDSAQQDIEKTVRGVNSAGKAYQAFYEMVKGSKEEQAAAADYARVNLLHLQTQLQQVQDQEKRLKDSGKSLLPDQSAQVNQLRTAEAQLKKMVEIGIAATRAYKPPKPPGGDHVDPPDQSEAKFANKVVEANTKLAAQLDLAQKIAEVSKNHLHEYIAGSIGQAQAALQHLTIQQDETREERVQVELTKQINALENDKHKLSVDQRAAIEQNVRGIIAAKDATEQAKAQAKLMTAEWTQAASAQKKYLDQAYKLAEAVQSEIADAQYNLETSTQVLGAMVTGGKDAATYMGYYLNYLDQSIPNAAQLAKIMTDVAAQQEYINALMKLAADAGKKSWEYYLDAATSAIDAVGGAVEDVIVQAFTKGSVDIKSIFKSLGESLVKIFADMIAEIVKNWLKGELAKTAITIQQAAVRKAADSAGGGSGGYTGGNPFAGTATSAAGTAGTSGATTGGMSASVAGAGAVIAAFVVTYLVVSKWIDSHQNTLNEFKLTSGTGGYSWSTMSKSSIEKVTGVAEQMVTALNQLVRGIGGVFDHIEGDLVVGRTGRGKHTDWFVTNAMGVAEHFGRDQQAAYEYAIIQAIKQSDIRGLSTEVQQAIRDSTATTAQQFQDEMAAALEKTMTRLGSTGAQVYQIFRKYADLISDMIINALKGSTTNFNRLNHPNLNTGGGGDATINPGDGLAPTPDFIPSKSRSINSVRKSEDNAVDQQIATLTTLIHARNDEVNAIRNQLIGVNDSASQRLAAIASFNRGIVEAQNVVNAQIEQVQTALTNLGDQTGEAADNLRRQLQAYLEQLQNLPEQIAGQQLDMAIFDTLYQYLEGSAKYEKQRQEYAKLKVMLEFEAIKAQLIALGKWEEFAGMFNDAYAAAMAAAGKPTHGGGHNNRQQREDAAQQRRDFIFDAHTRLGDNTPLQATIRDIQKKYDEEEKGLKKNSEQYRQLEILRQREIDLARQAAAQNAQNIVDELTGKTNVFTDLKKKFDDARKAVHDAGLSAAETARLMHELDLAERAAGDTLAMQQTSDLIGNIISMLNDGVLKTHLIAEQQRLNWLLQVANLETQYQILVASGHVAADVLKEIRDAIDAVEAQGPPVGNAGTDPNNPPPGATAWDGTHWIIGGGNDSTTDPAAERLKAAQDLLLKYQLDGLNKWERALKELNDDFATIRLAMGNTPEVVQAYADALARLRKEFLDGLQQFHDELATGAIGGATVQQQYMAAQSKYATLLAAVRGGDLSQADALRDAAQTLIDLAGQMFDTSTSGFQAIKQQLLDQIGQILGMPSTGSNVIGGPQWFTSGTAQTVMAITDVTGAVNSQTTVLAAKLDLVTVKLDQVTTAVNDSGNVNVPMALGF